MNNQKKSCGVVSVFKQGTDFLFLLVHEQNGTWCFPKGGQNSGEENIQTALRELNEEVGISAIEIVNDFSAIEAWDGTDESGGYHKEVFFFLGFVTTKGVSIQKEEIQDYRWVTYTEGMNLATFEATRQTLQKAHEYLMS